MEKETGVRDLRYSGSRGIRLFKVLPFANNHPEREVTFVQGQTLRIGVDVSEKAARYLVRDYPKELTVVEKSISTEELLEYKLNNLISDNPISKASLIKVVGRIFDKRKTGAA